MIIQSSNKPILVVLNDDISECVVKANLSRFGTIIKEWENDDMDFYDANGKHIIELPLTQEETAGFRTGKAIFEIKWLSNGTTQFSEQVEIEIVQRNDKGELVDES